MPKQKADQPAMPKVRCFHWWRPKFRISGWCYSCYMRSARKRMGSLL